MWLLFAGKRNGILKDADCRFLWPLQELHPFLFIGDIVYHVLFFAFIEDILTYGRVDSSLPRLLESWFLLLFHSTMKSF